MHREVHLGDADGVAVLLLSVEDGLLGRVAALVLDEVAGLHEHAARAAGRVEHRAVVRLDDVDDGLHDRSRREEFAVIVRFLDREFGEKVLVDAPEDIAGGVLDLLAVEQAHQVFEHRCLEDAVVLGQDAEEWLELRFDDSHGLGDELRQVCTAHRRLLHDPVVVGLLGQVEGAARDVVSRQDLALRHRTARLVGFDLPVCSLETIGRVTEEDYPQHRHEVVTRRELRVGPEVVCGLPEVGFELLDVVEGVAIHTVPGSGRSFRLDTCGNFEHLSRCTNRFASTLNRPGFPHWTGYCIRQPDAISTPEWA